MSDFTVGEMQAMQRTLQERYRHKWEPIGPETGRNKLLWMIGELGEVIDIVKKNGGTAACTDTALREALVEELADVLLCYGIDAAELKETYTRKFEKNMDRW